MTPAFQSRWPFRKTLGRHRTRVQPVRAASGRTIPGLIGTLRELNFQNLGRVAKVGVVLVGDRGMITSARIEEDLKPAGLDWISCLRAPAIQQLAAENGPLQPSLFDESDLAEISAPEQFPGERLIVCRNRDLASERARKREDLLVATERDLALIQARA